MPSAGASIWGTAKTAAQAKEPDRFYAVPANRPPGDTFDLDKLLQSPWLWVGLAAVVLIAAKKR